MYYVFLYVNIHFTQLNLQVLRLRLKSENLYLFIYYKIIPNIGIRTPNPNLLRFNYFSLNVFLFFCIHIPKIMICEHY